ncbi:MAG: hypothetical protein ACYDCN_03890 [Bacteroidia bacterium]
MSYGNIREEELKNKVAQDYFHDFDHTKIVGNIDFCVTLHTPKKQNQLFETESLLWAEAKKGKSNILESITQLILTIGKARTFDKNLPPAYLGAFDGEKIAFIPYNDIHDIFYQNDFNWNVTSSDHKTKEFKQVLGKVTATIEKNSLLFNFGADDKEIKTFIKSNFIVGKTSTSKIRIDKNNFTVIYNKWLLKVKPTIAVSWDIAKKNGLIDGDFYLADLLSQENETLKEKLFVLLKKNHYELDRKLDDMGMFSNKTANFTDNQKAHTQFWNKYERPPKQEYWDYIVERRDLLVPQDVRERKGSFFTPQIWVELSQKYLTDVLGENWQDEYYIWDCAAGTGNLLTGLTNKYNIWASTLDMQDVDVMHERIETMNRNSVSGHGANLLQDHVFQFDFLNDDFTKLPQPLQEIINNPKKRKKLVVYINPPYAEATNSKTTRGTGSNKAGVAISHKTKEKYKEVLKKGTNEIFAQFFARIYTEISGGKLAEFSKLKILQASNFSDFRNFFLAKLEKFFLVPADTFDNVKGQFPIGFFIWDTAKKEKFEEVIADVYDNNEKFIGKKIIYSNDKILSINKWILPFQKISKENIGILFYRGNDFQNQNYIYISQNESPAHDTRLILNQDNLIVASIYYTVRHCIEATWLNDRDQFLYPNNKWEKDIEFQNDCLAYTLFSNNIQSKFGTNNWIPFTEYEVGSREKFDSNFMTDFIEGRLGKSIVSEPSLFDKSKPNRTTALKFSKEAKALFKAGKALWQYYHKQPNCNVNASLYDIREYFQGRNEAGKMKNKSEDEHYMKLITDLRDNLKIIAKKIEPKVYEYGFLKA